LRSKTTVDHSRYTSEKRRLLTREFYSAKWKSKLLEEVLRWEI